MRTIAFTTSLVLAAAAFAAGCAVRGGSEGGDDAGADTGAQAAGEINGGTLDSLTFAVVGDTRPSNLDDTAGYPTAVIGRIWALIEARRPAFAITTGDYMFASPDGVEAPRQLDLYLGAQAAFKGAVWHAFGNHECGGYTNSNCTGEAGAGMTANYQAYMDKFQAPDGIPAPYFVVRYAAADGSWTARFVFVAPNAWSASQGQWLDRVLSETSTYTFVVRHENSSDTRAPGMGPSSQIIDAHLYTIIIAGHTHTYDHARGSREVVVGNGGAPLSGDYYGYVIATRRADGAIEFVSYDYADDGVTDRFAVKADGSPAD